MTAVPAVLAVLGRGVVPADTPFVRADDAGLVRGDGCFEGCRLRVGTSGTSGTSRASVDKLEAHLARFARSAAALDLPFDPAAWRELVAQAAAAWVATDPAAGDAAMKLVLTRGAGGTPTGFAWVTPIAAESLRQRRDGLRVITLERGVASDTYVGAPWLLGGVKTLSYAINQAALREAAARGVDDVLFVSRDGFVLEAPTASVVWADGRTLHTTPLAGTGILAGTTQALLFERAAAAGWTTLQTLARPDDLHAADGLWLISSVRGPVDVIELDGKPRDRPSGLDRTIRLLAGFPGPFGETS